MGPQAPQDPHEKAKRLARLIVEDLILYNQAKIQEGIKNDNLFELLAREIDAARRYYDKSVDATVSREADYFNWALVDLLVKRRGDIPSKIW